MKMNLSIGFLTTVLLIGQTNPVTTATPQCVNGSAYIEDGRQIVQVAASLPVGTAFEGYRTYYGGSDESYTFQVIGSDNHYSWLQADLNLNEFGIDVRDNESTVWRLCRQVR